MMLERSQGVRPGGAARKPLAHRVFARQGPPGKCYEHQYYVAQPDRLYDFDAWQQQQCRGDEQRAEGLGWGEQIPPKTLGLAIQIPEPLEP